MNRSEADLQAELAACKAERDEAFAREKAIAEVLEVINASAGDAARVFDAMLEKAMALCGAAFGHLDTYDGEHFQTTSLHSVPEAFAEFRRKNPPRYGPGTVPARLLAGEAVVQVPDLMATDVYRSGEPNRRAIVDLAGARAVLTVALRKKDILLGFINVFRLAAGPFSDKQVELLRSFASQAVIAMENARLIAETREALEQQTAMAEVLGVINASPGNLTPVFDTILEKATRLCRAVFGQLATYDAGLFRFVARHGTAPFLRQHPTRPLRPDEGVTWPRIVAGESLVHIADVSGTDLYRGGHEAARAFVDIARGRTLLTVALRKNEKLFGALTVYRQEVEPFSDRQIVLLQSFAVQAVIALENARLLDELRSRTEEVAGWNRELEARVAAQLGELERVGKLKRFLAPQIAELIVARGDEGILETHRRDIVVVFCDLRGFTAFAETAEPEEVLELLRDYHGALGPIVSDSEGTLDHFSGDGIMVFFNDPVPMPDASERAVRMAVAMRAAVAGLEVRWRRQGREIGFGVGIAHGYATLGQIGFADRIDYTAIGTVCNLAARLCSEAKHGQILLSRRVAAAVEENIRLEEIGELTLKGLRQAVKVYNVTQD